MRNKRERRKTNRNTIKMIGLTLGDKLQSLIGKSLILLIKPLTKVNWY